MSCLKLLLCARRSPRGWTYSGRQTQAGPTASRVGEAGGGQEITDDGKLQSCLGVRGQLWGCVSEAWPDLGGSGNASSRSAISAEVLWPEGQEGHSGRLCARPGSGRDTNRASRAWHCPPCVTWPGRRRARRTVAAGSEGPGGAGGARGGLSGRRVSLCPHEGHPSGASEDGAGRGVPRPSPSKPGQALSGRGAPGERRAPGPGRLREADGRWRPRGGSGGRKLPEGAWALQGCELSPQR